MNFDLVIAIKATDDDRIVASIGENMFVYDDLDALKEDLIKTLDEWEDGKL